jgi:hypothetical protein
MKCPYCQREKTVKNGTTKLKDNSRRVGVRTIYVATVTNVLMSELTPRWPGSEHQWER